MEVVTYSITISLWGHCPIEWIYLPSVGCSRGIIVIWDRQILELAYSHIGSFSICCKFKSLKGNFEWGLLGVYRPNDDHLRSALLEDCCYLSSWDIPLCLGGDSNVIRFPLERYTGGRLSCVMREFSIFINSCTLIDPPLEGARFTWSSHDEVPTLSHIDWFSYSIDWKITSRGFIK